MFHKTKGEKIFHGAIVVFMVLFCISIIVPFLNILATSLSSLGPVSAGEVSIFPKDITFDSYSFIFEDDQFFRSFLVSVAFFLFLRFR